jgi:hypothetical protein
MRVIFSRKGFDSSAGGCPSPIIGEQPISLPIPTQMPTGIRYEDLHGDYGSLVEDLTKRKFNRLTPCHLDPDLDASLLPRLPGWRGGLGQVGAAQTHLSNAGVTRGDLFLFWGLFRRVERRDRWTFVGSPEHRIFGWLLVDDIVDLGPAGSCALRSRPWLKDHPHARDGWGRQNALYVATEQLHLNNSNIGLPGWGVFSRGLRLTVEGTKPSTWAVPDWLNPSRGGVGMTYHPGDRWRRDGTLQCAARGQEFVALIEGRADATDWLRGLFKELV